MCDIISVISPPPGHTSYPKRKLEKLFSPQLGDEEWLVTIDSTGLEPVLWSNLAANILFMCEASYWERWAATPEKKCPLNNSLSVPRISRIHPGCHASCCHVVTWRLFTLSASSHPKAFILAKNVLEFFLATRYLIRIFWGLIKIHHLIVVKGQLIFSSLTQDTPLVTGDGV